MCSEPPEGVAAATLLLSRTTFRLIVTLRLLTIVSYSSTSPTFRSTLSRSSLFQHLKGTVGAVVTCPLEVVKTRLQSSRGVGSLPINIPHTAPQVTQSTRNASKPPSRISLIQCIRHIIETEGPRALFKGLGPNIVGVAPSRAIYFCTYSRAKALANQHLQPDTPVVHLTAASAAGFVACTVTNPIWFVKTRLQLDGKSTTAVQCIKRIYAQSGILGFYKGISASYFGISETVVHFVLYEGVKARLTEARRRRALANGDDRYSNPNKKQPKDFLEFMGAGAFSKTVASCIAYPHEVARTRLREEGNKYRSFWQTLHTIWIEEGYRGVYRGLGTQLIRQIPNTAIMMSTYEAVVYILTTYFNSSFYDST